MCLLDCFQPEKWNNDSAFLVLSNNRAIHLNIKKGHKLFHIHIVVNPQGRIRKTPLGKESREDVPMTSNFDQQI